MPLGTQFSTDIAHDACISIIFICLHGEFNKLQLHKFAIRIDAQDCNIHLKQLHVHVNHRQRIVYR